MFISTPTPLDEQTRFIVRFQIPNSDRTHVLEARVVWANWPMEGTGRSAGMGIEFIDSRECKALALELEQLEEA
jgi:Tfp pilus assembly protein PilZ